MASSFPKMQKGSANFSQSIRNRLRLKNLQAQAKNFCRVLDIRVAKIMKPHLRHPVFCYVLRNDRTTAGSANIGIVGTENQDRKRTGRQRLTPLPACSKKSIT